MVVDGAHNPAGARALAAYIDEFYSGERCTLIFGAMRDKSIEEIAEILFPRFGEVILVAPKQDCAMNPEALKGMVEHRQVRTAAGLEEAVAMADGTTFITGSLFLVGDAAAVCLENWAASRPYARAPLWTCFLMRWFLGLAKALSRKELLYCLQISSLCEL